MTARRNAAHLWATGGLAFFVLNLGACGGSTSGELFTGDVAAQCAEVPDALRYQVTSAKGATGKQLKKSVDEFLAARPLVFNTFECSATSRISDKEVTVAVPAGAETVLASPSHLAFRRVGLVVPAGSVIGELTDGQSLLPGREGDRYIVDAAFQPTPGISETLVESRSGSYQVTLTFTAAGARAFDDIAAATQGQQLAIVVDDIVQSAPVIQTARFNGVAQISGSFSRQEAQSLAEALSADNADLVFTPVEPKP